MNHIRSGGENLPERFKPIRREAAGRRCVHFAGPSAAVVGLRPYPGQNLPALRERKVTPTAWRRATQRASGNRPQMLVMIVINIT